MADELGNPDVRILLNPPGFANGVFSIHDGSSTLLSIDTDPTSPNAGDVTVHDAIRIGQRLDTGVQPLSLEAPDEVILRGGTPNDPWFSVVHLPGPGEMRLEAKQSAGTAMAGFAGLEVLLSTPLTGQVPGLRILEQDSVVLEVAMGLVDVLSTTDDAWLRLWSTSGLEEALVATGLLRGFTAPATHASLGIIDDDGQVDVYDSASTGSPGSTPCVRLQHGPDASLSVGTRSVQGRGQVRLAGGATTAPTLLVTQADDGQPIYWSAWRDGGDMVLRASSTVPTSVADGVQIQRFS